MVYNLLQTVQDRPSDFNLFFSFETVMIENPYISSDELRNITKCGSSLFQSKKLVELGISFTFDQYGTPMVKRSDLAKFLKVELQPLFEKMNLGGGTQT